MIDEKTKKVVAAAEEIFLRYGFKRATMGDIAAAAKMSRPALYLVFPTKEKIFSAVLAQLLENMLEETRLGVARFETAQEKLIFMFDIWSVRPFEIMQTSPDARDLHENSQAFASDVVATAFARLEALVAQALEPQLRAESCAHLSPLQIARILIGAVGGFKHGAKDVAELRQSIAGLLALVGAGLWDPAKIVGS